MMHKCNAYTIIIGDDNEILIDDAVTEQYYEMFQVDTDILEAIAFVMCPSNGKSDSFPPRDE
jgi:hypothetical protein